MDWKALGTSIAKLGLPLLGGLVGGPAGAAIGKTIASAIGLGSDASPEQVLAGLGNLTGEQLVALRALESDLEKTRIQSDTQIAVAQAEINKVEAGAGPWRGGWRPFIGWVCGLGFAFNFFILPVCNMIALYFKFSGPLPQPLDMTTMLPVMLGMLGLAAARTREKEKGLP